jgi:hypothetical protein
VFSLIEEESINNDAKNVQNKIMDELKDLGERTDVLLDNSGDLTLEAVLKWYGLATEYRRELQTMGEIELNKEYTTALTKKEEETALREGSLFFNHGQSEADLDYWASLSYWSPNEAVALSFCKDPKMVSKSKLEKLLKDNKLQSNSAKDTLKSFSRSFLERQEQVDRAQKTGDLEECIRPSDFFVWVEKSKICLETRFYEALRFKFESQTPQKAEDEPQGKTRNKYLELILGLAVQHYEPKHDLRNDLPKGISTKISNDLKTVSIDVNEKTIRKYLAAARDHIRSK